MSDTAPAGIPQASDEDMLNGITPSNLIPASSAAAYVAPSARGIVSRWLRLARPRLLLLSLAPTTAILALLWANGERLLVAPAVVSILAVALAQSGANLLDEYLEYERSRRTGAAHEMGRDEAGALLDEVGVVPLNALRAGIGLLIAGALVGIPLVVSGGVGVALLGLAGLGVAFLYSSTSYALKRLPGGEVVVFLALGPGIAVAVALAQHAHVSGPVLLIGCALGLLTLALMQATQVRGMDRHERMGRRVLVRYIGVRGCRAVYGLSMAGAFVLVALLALPKGAPHGGLAVLLAVPAALVALTGMLRARNTAARSLLPRQTFRVYALFALWLIIGLLASGIVTRIVAFVSQSGA
ncbi:MAG: prenyltransferase [Ktedonobacterales bacterium]